MPGITRRTVYADESASTGENLLDPAQPVFCAAAVYVDDELAHQVVDAVRAKLPPGHGEPKYTSLAKTPNGRAALLSAFDALSGATIQAYVAHKQFMVTSKMIDVLVVELAYDSGYNMYADGAAVALANLLHEGGRLFGDAAAYDQLLQTFVDAARKRTRASADDLFAAISAYQDTTKPEFSEVSGLLRYTRRQADSIIADIASGRVLDNLDPAVPCLVEACRGMAGIIGDFALIHDESKTLARHVEQLLRMHEVEDPARPGQLLERLPMTSFGFADSSTVPQLQIADWVAGAMRQWATQKATRLADPFAEDLGDLSMKWLLGGIWPDMSVVRNPRRIGPGGSGRV
ncbi:DUF3800 domain-containing protein [Streptomyces globisporus]|uniref:DUF3800 domain-containing protein n=1 Tax=Streptomyces globisporus TaxID=1908 RepID=UPI000AE980F2|nr:DUF3800 domain-containing protein [Streptomyces globisporus]AWL87180.1 DUF3800 domain-containing protein [Streptomyces globisporus]